MTLPANTSITDEKQSLSGHAPILVTGAHRTGTTWVGKMLTASGEAAYISEPFNVLHRSGVLRVPVQHWYTYICPQNEADYLAALKETLQFHYHPWAELKSLRSSKDALRMARDWGIFLAGGIFKKRPLLKDPFAVFSAPWFASQLGCQVVITIRHPAAFASSLKRLNWSFDFNNLLAQPLLMQDHLEPFADEMRKILQGDPGDIIGQSSLLWRMIYQTVANYRSHSPQFQIVRHEDLSVDPLQGYNVLYEYLGLHFTSQAQQTIIKSSSSENPTELSKNKLHAVHLDSQANLHNWKRRLSADEIARVRRLTEDMAALYYPEQTWD